MADSIDATIKGIERADCLTPAQRRDILYNIAARFLRLTKEQIDKHHTR